MTKKSILRVLIAIISISGVCHCPRRGSCVATTPDHGSFDFTDQFTDPDVCAAFGFAMDAKQHEYGFFTVYFDSDGDFLKVIVHDNVDFILTANGKTLIERDTKTLIITPDGRREVGSFTHIQGDHAGIVLHDAGQLVFDSEDNLLYARGRHPQFFGDETFCPALMP
jgi:hypothetical protein